MRWEGKGREGGREERGVRERWERWVGEVEGEGRVRKVGGRGGGGGRVGEVGEVGGGGGREGEEV